MMRLESEPNRTRTRGFAAAAGAMSGARSMSGVLALARANAKDPRGETRTRTVPLLGLLSAIEMLADKHPRAPARTSPPSFAARVLLGAVAGAGVAKRERTSAVSGAMTGVIAAAVMTRVAYRARMRLAARFRDRSPVPGLIEDAAVLAIGAVLVRALVR